MENEEMITIPKRKLIELEIEIQNLRKEKDVDQEFVDKMIRSFEDIKESRIKEWKGWLVFFIIIHLFFLILTLDTYWVHEAFCLL